MTDVDILAYQQVKAKKEAEDKEKQEKIASIEKPICPEKLKGAKCNGTIYGKKGNYCYYNNGEKVSLTNAEAIAITEYIKAKAEYNRKVKSI